MDRFARQTKLAEIGVDGQARIASATVDIALEGAAADVAARYLAGAGVACVRVSDAALAEGARALAPALRVVVDPMLVDEGGESFDLRDPACRDLARGAWVALRALQGVLAGSSAPRVREAS